MARVIASLPVEEPKDRNLIFLPVEDLSHVVTARTTEVFPDGLVFVRVPVHLGEVA